MKTILKFYKYIWKFKNYLLASIFALSSAQILANYSVYIFKDIIDQINKFGIQTEVLIQITITFLFIKLISILLNTLGNFMNDKYISKAGANVRIDVITKIHNLDFSFHAQKQSGSLISNIKRGDAAFWGVDFEINRSVIALIIDYAFIIVSFYTINSKLSFVIIASLLLNLFITKLIINKNIATRKVFNAEEDSMSGLIVDNMINYETVKLFAQEEWEQNRLHLKYDSWLKAFFKYANTFRELEILSGILGILGAGVATILAINLLSIQEISIGEFSLVLAFITNFFPKLTTFTYTIRNIAKQITDLERYLDILDLKIDVNDNPDAMELNKCEGLIEFKDLTFSYKDRNPILTKFNLKINKGESVALVGYSGAGKSTLMKLLLRYYDVNEGSVSIDGINIRDITKKSLRKNIGLVPQEPILFNETIAFNIAYPHPESTLNQVKHAANLANLDDFIESLPEKYNTIVGERGIKLSGGQKQRLAIARMFLADPQIIIFDEATSQLDSESEKLIQEAFWRIANGKTTMIIAHRLSTVMKADRIIVIDNGRIVEEGKHEELVKMNGGLYKKLWTLQKGVMLA